MSPLCIQTLASCASKSDGEMSGSTESRNRTLFVATTAISFFEASESTLSLYSFSLGFPILCISKKKLSPNIFLKKSALDSDSSIFPAKREFPI